MKRKRVEERNRMHRERKLFFKYIHSWQWLKSARIIKYIKTYISKLKSLARVMDKYRCPSPPPNLALSAKLCKITLKENEQEQQLPYAYNFFLDFQVIRNVEYHPFTITSSSEDEDDGTGSENSETDASGSSRLDENSEKLSKRHDLEVTDEHPDKSFRKKSRLIRPPFITKEDIFRLVENAKKHSVCGYDNQNDDSNSYEDEKKRKENLRSSSKTKQKKHHRYRSSDSDSSSKTKQKKHYRSNDLDSYDNKKMKYPRERSPCSSKTRYKYYPEDPSVYGESSFSQSGTRSARDDNESICRGSASYFCEMPDKLLQGYKGMIDEVGDNPSRPGFHCKLCNSHMNNKSAWQLHLTGKKHLKNMRKQSMKPAHKSRAQTKISDKPAKLMSALVSIDKPIVGLEYIRETQIPGIGENYLCRLCGASCSSDDIIEHLLLTKHRIKYLENIKHPDLKLISSLQMSLTSKDPLILEACRKAYLEHGPGKIEVVIKPC